MSRYQTTRTTTTAARKPKELDLNITDMRAKLQHELVTTMRDVMRKFDDLEALERLLHSEAAQDLTRRVGKHTNGNGNGAHRHGGHPDEVLPKRAYTKRKSSAPRTDGKKVQAAAVQLLETKPGASTQEIRQYLVATGVISPDMKTQSADTTVRDALLRAAKAGHVRAEREPAGMGSSYRYYPKVGAPAPAATPVTAEVAKPTKTLTKTTPTSVASSKGVTERLRAAITESLLSAKKPMTPVELTQAAIDQGLPEMVSGDRLSNYVNRVLRHLAEDRKVDRKGTVRGSIFYTIKRPTVHVTKAHNSKG